MSRIVDSMLGKEEQMSEFPKVNVKMTRGLTPLSYVLSDEGDELTGKYAGTGTKKLNNGKSVPLHYFVTDEGVATILTRYQIDKFLQEKHVKVGDEIHITRKRDRSFKKNGEKMTLHTFECELA